MPIPVNCPGCGVNLKVPDTAAGQKVKCPKCQTPFDVAAGGFGEPPPAPVQAGGPRRGPAPPPDDEGYDDEPYRGDQYRPPRQQGPGTGLQLGLGIAGMSVGILAVLFAWIPCIGAFAWPVAAIGLVLSGAGLIVAITKKAGWAFPIAGTSVSAVALALSLYWWFAFYRIASDATQFAREFEKAAKQNRPPFDFKMPDNKGFPVFKAGGKGLDVIPGVQDPAVMNKGTLPQAQGREILRQDVALTDQDMKDPARGSPAKVFTVNLQAGRTYQIDMVSKAFDCHLRVENAAGEEVARNDDGPNGNVDSQIVSNCTAGGQYRIYAGRLVLGEGPFTLRVVER